MNVRLGLAALALVAAVATAEDGAPAPAAPKDPLAPLRSAAKRQGGTDLLEAGGIRSMRIEFGRARGWIEVRQKDGSISRPDFDLQALTLDWLRHDDGSSSLRTRSVNDGQEEVAAIIGMREDIGWVAVGDEVASLLETTHPEQLRRMVRQRRVIDLLAEVMLLTPLLEDESRWTPLQRDDDPRPAFGRRTPEGQPEFAIVLDPSSHDIVEIHLPRTADAPDVVYELKYDAVLPHRSESAPRMPYFIGDVVRDRIGDDDRRRLELRILRVELNGVELSVLKRPTSSR